MDAMIDDEVTELKRLAAMVFDSAVQAREARGDRTGETRWNSALWCELATAGILAAPLPVDVDGMGLGMAAVSAIVEEQGRHVAAVPLWSSLVAARAVAAAGRNDVAGAMAEGRAILALALEEPAPSSLERPTTGAVPSGERWALTGQKVMVHSFHSAACVLVSATGPDGPGLFLIDPAAAGVTTQEMTTTALEGVSAVALDGVAAIRLGGPELHVALIREARIALSSLLIGVARGALQLAVEYTSAREQFGHPIGSFTAVQHRLADCWMQIDAARLVLAQAIADQEAGDARAASRSVDVADWWARRAAADTVYSAQHVHGGIGVDVDYPLHRYFLWGRRYSLAFGGMEQTLARLGDDLAETGALS